MQQVIVKNIACHRNAHIIIIIDQFCEEQSKVW